jgi:hypothetical protein
MTRKIKRIDEENMNMLSKLELIAAKTYLGYAPSKWIHHYGGPCETQGSIMERRIERDGEKIGADYYMCLTDVFERGRNHTNLGVFTANFYRAKRD